MPRRPDDAASQPVPASTVSTIRSELEVLRRAVSRIETQLATLEREDPGTPAKERPRRYYEVLADVYDQGGRLGLDFEAFGRVGERHGYDRRGLGGFFTGARAPLRRKEGTVVLSPFGEGMLDSFLLTVERDSFLLTLEREANDGS